MPGFHQGQCRISHVVSIKVNDTDVELTRNTAVDYIEKLQKVCDYDIPPPHLLIEFY